MGMVVGAVRAKIRNTTPNLAHRILLRLGRGRLTRQESSTFGGWQSGSTQTWSDEKGARAFIYIHHCLVRHQTSRQFGVHKGRVWVHPIASHHFAVRVYLCNTPPF